MFDQDDRSGRRFEVFEARVGWFGGELGWR
jgi:hypothetical protein